MLTAAERWMREALCVAQVAADHGEAPIGAVIVRDGVRIAEAHNWRETWRDPTAHAEILALREASRVLGGWRLTGCDLYVTLEPCPMCAGAAILARVRHVYFGASDPKGGAVVSKTELLTSGTWNHDLGWTGGVLADECGMILHAFFRDLRTRRDV